MLITFLRTMSSCFCPHEWSRRSEPGRLYLECVNCLATTPGIEVSRQALEPTKRPAATGELVMAKA